MSDAADLLAELAGCRIELQADGERLRFRPRSAMTAALTERVRACKPELLALLRADDATDAAGAEPELPPRPAERRGYVTELILRDGRPCWRQRRADAADRAIAAWYASPDNRRGIR